MGKTVHLKRKDDWNHAGCDTSSSNGETFIQIRDSQPLEEDILSFLRSSSSKTATRKKIQKKLAQTDEWHNDHEQDDGSINLALKQMKKKIKSVLRHLVKQGRVSKNGDQYTILEEQKKPNTALDNEKEFVPIAERIRRQKLNKQTKIDGKTPVESNPQRKGSLTKTTINKETKEEQKTADLDEEIRRLEAELAADSNSDGDDDDYSEWSEEEDTGNVQPKKSISFGANSTHVFQNDERKSNLTQQSHDERVICLSEVAGDRIEPLPLNSLPQSKRRLLKGIDSSDVGEPSKQKQSKKRKRENSARGNIDKKEHNLSEGLKDAVEEMLQSYVPSSQLDRPPLYCRVCKHQSSSLSEFEAHRKTELHVEAVKQEKKKTYCRLCQKQMTSLVQMEEHLRSRPHRERLDFMKAKQNGGGLGGGREGRLERRRYPRLSG
ncbi:hypothetical protein ACHAXS_004196 [Conticribra weissflogii]